jgi:hypothetical protein
MRMRVFEKSAFICTISGFLLLPFFPLFNIQGGFDKRATDLFLLKQQQTNPRDLFLHLRQRPAPPDAFVLRPAG